jgi:membrane fusion protein, multidrug efflux system
LASSRFLALPRGWQVLAVLGVIAVGSYVGWRYFWANRADTTAGGKANSSAAVNSPPIPVTVAGVLKADFPVYLNSLGTVQPFRTVTVRSRVDGQITKIGFRQGRTVTEGDVLVEIDPRPYQATLAQAQAKKTQDQSMLKDAKLNLDRYLSLADKNVVTKQQLDTQQATVDQLTAQVQGDDAAIENAQTQLSYTTIKAPLTGRAGFRLVDPGNIVHASDQNGVVTIVQLQPISVVFTAPEEAVPQINSALEAGSVPVRALSSDGLRTLAEGRLALVNNEVDEASGTIRMKATFENKDNVLWPGLSVATRLLADTLKDAVVVPDDAVQRGPDGLYVFVVGDDSKVSVQPITVSQNGEGRSVIERGLTAGQKIVVAGQYRLVAGAAVQPSEAPAPGGLANEAKEIPSKAP